MVASTPIAVVLSVIILITSSRHGLLLLFLTFPFGAAAAFLVPGIGSVTITDVCVLAFCLGMLLRVPLHSLYEVIRPGSAGFALMVLLALATLSAWFYPRLFIHDTQVFALGSDDGRPAIIETALQPTGSNFGQLARLHLSGMAFVVTVVVAQLNLPQEKALQAVLAATVAHIVVSFIDWFGHPLGLSWLLEPLRTVVQAILVDQSFPSLRRIIGGYTEPASFGLFTMGLLGFWLRYWFLKSRSIRAAFLTFILLLLAVRSTSTATITNATLLLVLFPLVYAKSILESRARLFLVLFAFGSLPAVYALISVGLGYSPMGSDLINDLIWNKVVSTSGEERLSWNIQAYQNLVDTFGLGAGIGSVRASSWIVSVLASMGILGAGVYCWFLWEVLRSKSEVTMAVPSACRWGCFVIVMQSSLTKPFPDLGVPFFAMAGIAVGLEMAGQMQPRTYSQNYLQMGRPQ